MNLRGTGAVDINPLITLEISAVGHAAHGVRDTDELALPLCLQEGVVRTWCRISAIRRGSEVAGIADRTEPPCPLWIECGRGACRGASDRDVGVVHQPDRRGGAIWHRPPRGECLAGRVDRGHQRIHLVAAEPAAEEFAQW